MSRRRLFDIELPEDAEEGEGAPAAAPAAEASAPPRRRGPMAAAVRETADSLAARREIEAEIRAENDALAHAYAEARAAGLVLERVPLDRIDATRLARDRRRGGPDPEIEELKASVAGVGLSNPVRLERKGDRFELIQGWRRLAAFRALHAETGEERFAAIPAAVTEPDPDLEQAYRRMVDENLVRKDVSFAEMATLARSYAEDPRTPAGHVDAAVDALFAAAASAKRSHIRAFAELLGHLDGSLAHPEAIPRNLGLALRRRIGEGRLAPAQLVRALEARPERTAEEELAILRVHAGEAGEEVGASPAAPAGRNPSAAAEPAGGGRGRASRLRFALPTARGEAVCLAADGRLELRAEADFSRMERRRLEAAAAAFFRALDG